MGKKTNFEIHPKVKKCIKDAKIEFEYNNSTYQDISKNGGWTREQQICEAVRICKHENEIK